MNYGKILYCDTGNGIGCRTVIFVSGCRHHCKECFNPMTWDFQYGKPYTTQTKEKIIESLEKPYINGITILGGEPFEPENQLEIKDLVQSIRQTLPDKTIWIYSGYLWEELLGKQPSICHTEHTMDILSNTDILIDGEFEIEKKNIMLNFRGSENQRIIDVQKSLNNQTAPVLSEYM